MLVPLSEYVSVSILSTELLAPPPKKPPETGGDGGDGGVTTAFGSTTLSVAIDE